MTSVTFHVSRVTCHLSCVTYHMSPSFFGQSSEAIQRTVCYQWGLPSLVFNVFSTLEHDIIQGLRSACYVQNEKTVSLAKNPYFLFRGMNLWAGRIINYAVSTLHCTDILHCNALLRTIVYCTTQYCTALHCNKLHCNKGCP